MLNAPLKGTTSKYSISHISLKELIVQIPFERLRNATHYGAKSRRFRDFYDLLLKIPRKGNLSHREIRFMPPNEISIYENNSSRSLNFYSNCDVKDMGSLSDILGYYVDMDTIGSTENQAAFLDLLLWKLTFWGEVFTDEDRNRMIEYNLCVEACKPGKKLLDKLEDFLNDFGFDKDPFYINDKKLFIFAIVNFILYTTEMDGSSVITFLYLNMITFIFILLTCVFTSLISDYNFRSYLKRYERNKKKLKLVKKQSR